MSQEQDVINVSEQSIRILDTVIGLYYMPNTSSAMYAYGPIGIPAIFNAAKKEVSIPIYSTYDIESAKIIASRNKLQTVERRMYGGRAIGQPKGYIVLLNCIPTDIKQVVNKLVTREPFVHSPESFRDADFLGKTLYEQRLHNIVLSGSTLLNIVSKMDGGQDDEETM